MSYEPQISLRLEPELNARLQRIAKRLGYNRSEIVRRAILDFVEVAENAH